VGIFAEEIVATDTLGRRTGPWTRHTVEEKLRIVEETRARGASVATVARRHNVSPNQVFGWRHLYRRGLLHPQAAKGEGRRAKGEGRSQDAAGEGEYSDGASDRASSAHSAEPELFGA
jgi:transposase-like protein